MGKIVQKKVLLQTSGFCCVEEDQTNEDQAIEAAAAKKRRVEEILWRPHGWSVDDLLEHQNAISR